MDLFIRRVHYDGIRDMIENQGSSIELSVQRCQTAGWDDVQNCGKWVVSYRFAAVTAVSRAKVSVKLLYISRVFV